jgi:hypothetical protein
MVHELMKKKGCSGPVYKRAYLLLLLIIVIAVLFLLLSAQPKNPIVKSETNTSLNVTDIVSVFNPVGYEFFDKGGYSIFGDVIENKFQNSATGNIQGYETTVRVSDISVSSTIVGFIFNSTTAAQEVFNNDSKIYSFFEYESNTSVSAPNTEMVDGVEIKFYNITTSFPMFTNPNNTVSYGKALTCGSSFYYRNVLFVGNVGTNVCSNAMIYLITLLNETYG